MKLMASMVKPVGAGTSPDEAVVLSKAVIRAALLLGLTQKQVAEALGMSGPSASRLFAGRYRLSRARAKEWELGVLFVRFFRSLDALWGHEESARSWLKSYNTGLGAAPVELLGTVSGLVRLVDHLDNARGRV
ncbi:MAG: antitoxin Xre/MbcA/ParS toxin-binding domain-containing protein [Steroidobacteraceae bacterium]